MSRDGLELGDFHVEIGRPLVPIPGQHFLGKNRPKSSKFQRFEQKAR